MAGRVPRLAPQLFSLVSVTLLDSRLVSLFQFFLKNFVQSAITRFTILVVFLGVFPNHFSVATFSYWTITRDLLFVCTRKILLINYRILNLSTLTLGQLAFNTRQNILRLNNYNLNDDNYNKLCLCNCVAVWTEMNIDFDKNTHFLSSCENRKSEINFINICICLYMY